MSYRRRFGAILFALLLVTSLGVTGVGSVAADEDVDEADEVYVNDDGSAVLVYEEDHEEDEDLEDVTGEFGMETSTGLVHLLYRGDVDDTDVDEEFTAEMEASMTPEEVTAWGDFAVDAPEDVEELDVDVESERTETNSETTAEARMVVADESAESVAIDAQADLEATASTFTSSGSVDATVGPAVGPEEVTEVSLAETDGTYELEATERNLVTQWEREQWETEEAARRTLESQYAGTAMALGGTAEVDLETYEFEETPDGEVVSLEYSVTFEGVKEGVGELLAQELAADQELDLDENEAQAIADRMTALEIDRIDYSLAQQGGDVDAEWDVSLENYDEVVLGFVELSESIDDLDDDLADEYDDVDEYLEAMDEADAAYTAGADLSVQGESGQVVVDLTASSATENYGEYVTELEDRDLVEYTAETTFEFTAGLAGEQLEANVDYETVGEELLDSTIEGLIASTELQSEDDEEFVAALENFQDAELEAAKSNVDANEDEFEVRAAAAFEDLGSFENVPFETDDNLSVTAVHGETENGTTTAYLTVEDFADPDADEDELREHDRVGEDTEIHLAGDWDREFPAIDVADVGEYLGLELSAVDEETEDGESGDDMPGFGPVVAIAGLAGALFALRRY